MATSSEPSFWDFKGIDEYSDNKLLISSPYPVIAILIAYLVFVLKIGPNYMKNRPPMDVQNWLLGYNILQVIVTFATFLAGSHFLLKLGVWHTPCYVEKDLYLRRTLQDGSHCYFLTKIVELIDTVFFVLRKKQRQVSFLHVYHHTIMVMATWLITKYSRTDAVTFLGVINSLVHVIMYTYYGLSAYPHLAKYLWWKKYITMMQLIQFIMMFMHVVVSHYISECRPAYYLLSSVCFNTVLFLYLFGDFYVKSYMKKYKTRGIVDAGRKLSTNLSGKNGINYIINHHALAGKIN